MPPRRRAEQPAPRPQELATAPAPRTDDLDRAAALAVTKGFSDGYSYVQNNLDAGMTIDKIIKGLNEQ